MASNKNQHFVPRCYLKAFTDDTENKTINVFNIDRKKFIPQAPVKTQCSKDYFYGKDEKLEHAIQVLEQSYASILRGIIGKRDKLCDDHKIALKRFWLFQYFRTEAASIRSAEMSNDLAKVAGVSSEDFKMGIKESVQIAMETFAKNIEILDDLKLCLISNKSQKPFVTSDDPAVLTNRWHLNDHRSRFRSFGLNSCGNILLLPLTPQILCVAYDGDVYSIPQEKGWASISKESDVKAFNEHQLLNCRANVFFKKAEDVEFVKDSFDAVEKNRISDRHRINCAVLDCHIGQSSRYKVVDHSEAGEHEEVLLHSQTVHSIPMSWSNVIRWRNGGYVYTNGTGLGFVRKGQILRDYEGFYKVLAKLKNSRA